MTLYNYLHHRRGRRRAGIERKRGRIQRRRSQKSYQQRHEDKPEVTQAMKSEGVVLLNICNRLQGISGKTESWLVPQMKEALNDLDVYNKVTI